MTLTLVDLIRLSVSVTGVLYQRSLCLISSEAGMQQRRAHRRRRRRIAFLFRSTVDAPYPVFALIFASIFALKPAGVVLTIRSRISVEATCFSREDKSLNVGG